MAEEPILLMQDLINLKRRLLDSVSHIDKQIEELEMSKAELALPIEDEIHDKELILKELVLTRARSLKIPGLTAVYQVKTLWDTEGLLSMAEEVPAIRQWHRAIAHVALRYKS